MASTILIRYKKKFLSLGTSEGNLLVLNIPPRGEDPEVVFTRQLQGHSGAVCDLATNEQEQLASCDENGMIIVWVDPTLSAESARAINEPGYVGGRWGVEGRGPGEREREGGGGELSKFCGNEPCRIQKPTRVNNHFNFIHTCNLQL